MLKKIFVRLFYGLLFAVPLMLLTYVLAQAGAAPQAQPPQTTPQLICPACHESFQKAWETSAHGKSSSDPTFKKAWEAQGMPGDCLTCHVTGYDPDTNTMVADGITCQACHDTTAANHPMEPMAADRSAKLCGKCHQETYFEWQVSAHRAEGLDCVGCHDPHATSLKAEDTANSCTSCHRERASNFAHSQHSTQGLTCKDCHLAPLGDPTEGHARLDHSFNVQLSTCNRCHAYQMHDPAEVHPDNPTPQPPDSIGSTEVNMTDQPGQANPLGFATLSGIFGLALGVIVAPIVERAGRRTKKSDKGE